jgi:hypothetical protein
MNRSIFKTIVFGSLFGALAFAAPFFLVRTFFLFLIVGGLLRLFVGARFRCRGMYVPVFADKIRNMSDDEYAAFRERFNGGGCGRRNRFNNETFKTDGPDENDFVQSPSL